MTRRKGRAVRRAKSRWRHRGKLGNEGRPELDLWQRNVGDGFLSVMFGESPGGRHMSIDHRLHKDPPAPGRWPTMTEVMSAIEDLMPTDLELVLVMPKRTEFAHPDRGTTLHLYEWGAPEADE